MKKCSLLTIIFLLLLCICIYSFADDPEPQHKGTMVDDLKFDDYVYTTAQADTEFGKAVTWTNDDFDYSIKVGELTIGDTTTNVLIPDVVTNLSILIEDANPPLKTPENVDDLIQNQQKLIEILKEYSGIDENELNNSVNTFGRDGEDDIPSFLLNEGVGGGIFTNEYFNGHYETSNIVAFFPFYNVGKKFLNFGTDFPTNNTGTTIFGLAEEWKGIDPTTDIVPIPGNNSYAEAMQIKNDGYSRSGAMSETEYDPLGNADRFTIMAWIYRNDSNSQPATASRIVADLAGTTDGPGFQLRVSTANGILSLFINPIDGNDNVSSTTAGGSIIPIQPNSRTWHHIAVSFDNTASGEDNNHRTVNFYVDGLRKNPNSQTAAVWSYKKGEKVTPNNASFTIGTSSGGDTYQGQFIGFMDDLLVFRGWVPKDYDGYTIPGTEQVWTDEDIVTFWMNMNDAILENPDVSGLSVDFGQFNPRDPIYSSDQVNKLLGISEEGAREILGEDPIEFGQFNLRTNIYSAEEFDDVKDKFWH